MSAQCQQALPDQISAFLLLPNHQWTFLKAYCYETNKRLRIILLGNKSTDWQVNHFPPCRMLRYVGTDQTGFFCLHSLQIGNSWSVTDVVKFGACKAIKRCHYLRLTQLQQKISASALQWGGGGTCQT